MLLRVEDVSHDFLEAHYVRFRDAMAFVDASGGCADAAPERFGALLDTLQIFAPQTESTPYVHCGLGSTTSTLYGRRFAAGLTGRSHTASAPFEALVRATYRQVHHSGRPLAQRITARIDVHGRQTTISFYRYVFPLRFQGFEAVGCMAQFVLRPV